MPVCYARLPFKNNSVQFFSFIPICQEWQIYSSKIHIALLKTFPTGAWVSYKQISNLTLSLEKKKYPRSHFFVELYRKLWKSWCFDFFLRVKLTLPWGAFILHWFLKINHRKSCLKPNVLELEHLRGSFVLLKSTKFVHDPGVKLASPGCH